MPLKRPPPARPDVPATGAPQRVRIIGGRWRRTPLPVASASGLRPTPDRVRETLFNWLGHDLSGLVCVDLFAGTGALGLEAASRGAAAVWLAETDARAFAALQAVIERLQAADRVHLPRGDARQLLARLASQGVRADLVFIDPPFHQDTLSAVMPALAPVLAARAWVYVEAETTLDEATVRRWCGPGASILRQARAGQVHYHLLQIDSAPAGPQENP